MTGMEIQTAVSEKQAKVVLSLIQNKGTQVRFFDGNHVLSSFSILIDAAQNTVYIVNTSSEKPFIISLPGHTAMSFLVFSADENLWRDKCLMRYQPNDIAMISSVNTTNPDESFRIKNFGKSHFGLLPMLGEKLIATVDSQAMTDFLLSFRTLSVDRFLNTNNDSLLNTFKKQQPFFILTVNDIYKQQVKIACFQKLNNKDNKMIHDFNLFYILLNEKEAALARYVQFDQIIKGKTAFVK